MSLGLYTDETFCEETHSEKQSYHTTKKMKCQIICGFHCVSVNLWEDVFLSYTTILANYSFTKSSSCSGL